MNSATALLEHLSRKKHIIWDWNGTLLADVEHAVKSVNGLLEPHGLPAIDIARYKKIFGFPVIQYYLDLGFDFERESFPSLCDRFTEKFMTGFRDLELIPTMKGVVQVLNADGKTQSILSATMQKDLDEMIAHYRLRPYFAHVYGIDNKFAASKVARGVELMNAAGIAAADTIIVGDTLHDLEVARELGIDAALLSHGHQCATRLREQHDQVFEF